MQGSGRWCVSSHNVDPTTAGVIEPTRGEGDISKREAIMARWMTDHRGIIVKVARSFARDAHDQDDLVQEILVTLWASIPRFRGESKASTWIYGVALNRALTWDRGEARRRQHQEPVPDERLLGTADPLGRASPEEALRLRQLYDGLRRQPEIDRSLLLLSLDGFSYDEMATVTGLSVSNVGARLSRARARLAAEISDGHDDSEKQRKVEP